MLPKEKVKELSLLLLFYAITSDLEISNTGPGCGGELVAQSAPQSFASPGYPTTEYTNNLVCTWRITSEEGKIVWFNITELETEHYHDRVEVYDGKKFIITYSNNSFFLCVKSNTKPFKICS